MEYLRMMRKFEGWRGSVASPKVLIIPLLSVALFYEESNRVTMDSDQVTSR